MASLTVQIDPRAGSALMDKDIHALAQRKGEGLMSASARLSHGAWLGLTEGSELRKGILYRCGFVYKSHMELPQLHRRLLSYCVC